MRNISFRAWDKERKIMGMVRYIDWDDNLSDFTELGTDKYFDYCDEDALILMQYTGLKDKNGKEIWEGDIVKFIGGNYQVKYNQRLCAFVLPFKNDLTGMSDYHSGEAMWGQLEVLGNKYEQPELLEEK